MEEYEILNMRILYIALMVVIYMATGCSASSSAMSGIVVDAETGKPIEDAVVLVEWTKAEGLPGLVSTKSYKVVEAFTDKDGKFAVEDLKKLRIDPPDVTVYKKGYVAWSSRIIFPDYRNRKDFTWENDHVFKLEHFKESHSHYDHYSFILSAAHTESASEEKQHFKKAYDWEIELAIKERDEKWHKKKETAK